MKYIKCLIMPIFKGLIMGLLLAAILMAIPHKSDSYLMQRSVKLISAEGQCSGEQVRAPSGKDYILTASHCRPLAVGGYIQVVTEEGKRYKSRVISEDPYSDLLLLQGIPNLRGLDIAYSARRHDPIRTFTHGAGHDTYETEGNLMEATRVLAPIGQIRSEADEKACHKPKNHIEAVDGFFGPMTLCFLDLKETVSTAMTVPGSSGGMVVNAWGDLVGVVSAGDGHFSMFVQLKDIQRFLSKR